MERICKNCRLFNQQDSCCSVTVLIKGEKYELPVNPKDECHWERIDKEVNQELKEVMIKNTNNVFFIEKAKQELQVPVGIKYVRTWSDGKNGFIEEG